MAQQPTWRRTATINAPNFNPTAAGAALTSSANGLLSYIQKEDALAQEAALQQEKMALEKAKFQADNDWRLGTVDRALEEQRRKHEFQVGLNNQRAAGVDKLLSDTADTFVVNPENLAKVQASDAWKNMDNLQRGKLLTQYITGMRADPKSHADPNAFANRLTTILSNSGLEGDDLQKEHERVMQQYFPKLSETLATSAMQKTGNFSPTTIKNSGLDGKSRSGKAQRFSTKEIYDDILADSEFRGKVGDDSWFAHQLAKHGIDLGDPDITQQGLDIARRYAADRDIDPASMMSVLHDYMDSERDTLPFSLYEVFDKNATGNNLKIQQEILRKAQLSQDRQNPNSFDNTGSGGGVAEAAKIFASMSSNNAAANQDLINQTNRRRATTGERLDAFQKLFDEAAGIKSGQQQIGRKTETKGQSPGKQQAKPEPANAQELVDQIVSNAGGQSTNPAPFVGPKPFNESKIFTKKDENRLQKAQQELAELQNQPNYLHNRDKKENLRKEILRLRDQSRLKAEADRVSTETGGLIQLKPRDRTDSSAIQLFQDTTDFLQDLF